MGFAPMPEFLVLIITLHVTLHNIHRMNLRTYEKTQQDLNSACNGCSFVDTGLNSYGSSLTISPASEARVHQFD